MRPFLVRSVFSGKSSSGSPSTTGSETGDRADTLEGLDLSIPYRFSDSFDLRARYEYYPESSGKDESPVAPPTIEFLDEAESPPDSVTDNTSTSIAYDGGVGGPAPASEKTWDKVWAEYFFGKRIDPLDPDSIEEFQNDKEKLDKRTQAAAEFTQAATTVVTAGLPSPLPVSTAGTIVISETAGAVVDGETSEEPGILDQVWNVITSAASWIGSWFD